MIRAAIRSLNKPEYLFYPKQLARRIRLAFPIRETGWRTLPLPWGTSIHANVDEDIGRALLYLGVYDLAVSETLFRLIDPGEAVADLGANIGYMSILMASRAGTHGKVFAFEPHPKLYEVLVRNAGSWIGNGRARIETVQAALSESSGIARLEVPDRFDENMGRAHLTKQDGVSGSQALTVSTVTLDEYFENQKAPSVIKVDVEGAEARVFLGATTLLKEKKIRDIIFEDHEHFPSPAMKVLLDCGYTLFRIQKKFAGPCLIDPRTSTESTAWEPPSYVATADSERATRRLSPWGWQLYRRQCLP